MKRRTFLGVMGAVGAASVAAEAADATVVERSDAAGILVDLTKCLGCRSCEMACAEANGLEKPEIDWSTVNDTQRTTSDRHFTVVNQHATSQGAVHAKRQCMHCLQPACAAACPTKALVKTPSGPVVWRADKCMGCRFCMVSCPFDAPKFEYDSPNPRIMKCGLCWERLGAGEQPACVANCPTGALTFGRRSELLEDARRRIGRAPDRYVSHIYGEHEAGGTSVLYLSPVPFEELAFPTALGTMAFPEFTRNFLTAVPMIFILWPAFMIALRRATVEAERSRGLRKDGESTTEEV